MVRGWCSPEGDLPPTPDGAVLHLSLPCVGYAEGGRHVTGEPHALSLAPDWSVLSTAPLRGSHAACGDLALATAAAAHDLAQLAARRALPPLRRMAGGRWELTAPVAACGCAERTFATPASAFAHASSARHLASRYGAPAEVLAQIARDVEAAHGGFSLCPPAGWSALQLVREPRGLDALWAAGVSAAFVAELWESVWAVPVALPTEAYLGAAFHCADLRWLRSTAAVGLNDPEVMAWAAWSWGPEDQARPTLRRAWLTLGLALTEVDDLMASGVTLEDAEDLAEGTGRTVRAAARLLAAWQRAGCCPGAGDIAALDLVGVTERYRPSASTVDVVLRQASRAPVRPTRTQAAVLLALAGTPEAVLPLLTQGLVTTEQALAALT